MTDLPAIFRRSLGPALALALLAAAPLGQAVTLFDYGADWKLWRGKKTPSRPDYWAWTKADHDDSDWETASTPVFFGENVNGGTELEDYLFQSRRILAALAGHHVAALRDAGVELEMPDGAFYLFPDFSPLAARLAGRGIRDSGTLCERLLEETGVAVVFGAAFGLSPNFRVSYATSEAQLEEACRRLGDWQRMTGDENLFVSVNISSRQLIRQDLIGDVKTVIELGPVGLWLLLLLGATAIAAAA
mgnify:CR=1 FL=1